MKAVCLLSGGLDSAACLAFARREGFECYALSFDYGQRHRIELESASRVARALGAAAHRTAQIDLRVFGHSALTDEIAVPKDRDETQMNSAIPVTYVPARNTIFLSFALAWAEVLEANDIFIGVNALDYSGYPDCRPEFIHAFETMSNLATKAGVEGRTRDQDSHSSDRALEVGDRAPGARAQRAFRTHAQLLRPGCGRARVRSVRFVHPAREGFSRSRHSRSRIALIKIVNMKIAEIFYSVQGEGGLVGVPSVFIRTSGCNLRCSWCDTPYASWNPEGEDLTIDRILDTVAEFPAARHAVITGGEPLIAPGVVELSRRLRALGLHITIETAGTVAQEVSCDLMSISPKLSNSTPEGPFRAQHERLRLQPEVLRRLMTICDYQLKFVVRGEEDLEEVRAIAAVVDAPAGKVILMPEGVCADVLAARGIRIAELCKEYGYRFSPRLHVDLYGNRRGV